MIDITMPALSPTMDVGTLSKWLVAVGDAVSLSWGLEDAVLLGAMAA